MPIAYQTSRDNYKDYDDDDNNHHGDDHVKGDDNDISESTAAGAKTRTRVPKV